MASFNGCVVIGIVGPTCSGKSTLADSLRGQSRGRAFVLAQGDYCHDRTGLSDAELTRLNLDHPSAVDFALLNEHVRSLRAGVPVEKPAYCPVTRRRTPGHVVTPHPIIVVEGAFLFGYASLAKQIDLKVFLALDKDIVVKRRLRRDLFDRDLHPIDAAACFHEHVWPSYKRYAEPTKHRADMVISGEFDSVTIARKLLARVRPLQRRRSTVLPVPTADVPASVLTLCATR
jgi:uridine kinase